MNRSARCAGPRSTNELLNHADKIPVAQNFQLICERARILFRLTTMSQRKPARIDGGGRWRRRDYVNNVVTRERRCAVEPNYMACSTYALSPILDSRKCTHAVRTHSGERQAESIEFRLIWFFPPFSPYQTVWIEAFASFTSGAAALIVLFHAWRVFGRSKIVCGRHSLFSNSQSSSYWKIICKFAFCSRATAIISEQMKCTSTIRN